MPSKGPQVRSMNPGVPPVSLFDPLTLPNGAVISNRICKAAMEETMGVRQLPCPPIYHLYETWAKGGAGLIITGNVMVDRTALIGPLGLTLDERQPFEPFKAWARAATSGGTHAWMQINHPGRQVFDVLGLQAVAPSAIRVEIQGNSHRFPVPRALGADEISAIVARFATTAKLAEKAGFTGVQIHAAHGYLISQFLSPLTNRRTDEWGGSLENRARFLLEVVKAVRAAVSPGFCFSLKLNSADFQRGGFDANEAVQVVRWLNELPVDLLELSGGTYESTAMQGTPQVDSTVLREAYFIEFARDIAAVARMPVMVTGGIRRRAVAEEALQPRGGRPGVAMAGIASAMAFEPDLPNKWKAGESLDVEIPEVAWKDKTLVAAGKMALKMLQLRRLGKGLTPNPGANPLMTIIAQRIRYKLRSREYRRGTDAEGVWIAPPPGE
jgi:2,4-dienoyl-CoA reductase-like NADH-dependent reductase (Old Yellow Enzyme family)